MLNTYYPRPIKRKLSFNTQQFHTSFIKDSIATETNTTHSKINSRIKYLHKTLTSPTKEHKLIPYPIHMDANHNTLPHNKKSTNLTITIHYIQNKQAIKHTITT